MGSPIIFSGNTAKTLKDTIDFFGQGYAVSKSVDPTATATTAPKGSLLLSTLTGKIYRKLDAGSSTNWAQLADGAGYKAQFIKNWRGENSTTGWTAYDDGAVARPIDGTGGSPSVVSVAVTTSNPLSGTTSLQLVKTAADGQGEGLSYDFAIDRGARTAILKGKLKYEIASGTYSGGTLTTDSDVIAYLYRVDSTARLIEPIPFKLTGAVVGQQYEVPFEFQTDSDATNYRLIFHVATTSASAYTLNFEVQLGYDEQSQGAFVGPWTAFVPTGSWNTNSTYTGFKKRVADCMHYMVQVSLSGAPNSATLTFNTDTGEVIDVNKLTGQITDSGSGGNIGDAFVLESGVTNYLSFVSYMSTTSVVIRVEPASGSFVTNANVTQANPHTFKSGDKVVAIWSVPIVGLGANQVLSSDAATRTIGAQYRGNGGEALTADVTNIPFATKVFDTHGGWGGSSYTAPISGAYTFKGSIRLNAGANLNLDIYIDGTQYIRVWPGQASTQGMPFDGTVWLNSGQVLSLRSDTNTTLQAGTTNHWMNIARLSGPEQVAASERVYAEYEISGSTANTSLANNTDTTVDADVKIADSHGAVTVGANWVFKAPKAGTYGIAALVTLASGVAGTINNKLEVSIFKNGSRYRFLGFFRYQLVVTAVTASAGGSTIVQLNAGDTLSVVASQNTGGAVNISTTADEVHICVWSTGGVG